MNRRSLKPIQRRLGKIRLTMDSSPLQASENRIGDADTGQRDIDPEERRIPVFIIGVLLSVSGFILVAYGAKRFEDCGLKRKTWREYGWLGLGGCVLFAGFSLMFVVVPFLL
jgi:hypothetical protein